VRGNDIAVNSRRLLLLFLWRDKRIPPLVPLSCLANKMIHSRNLCKSPPDPCGNRIEGLTWWIAPARRCLLRARTVFRCDSSMARLSCVSTPMSLVGQREAMEIRGSQLVPLFRHSVEACELPRRASGERRGLRLGGRRRCGRMRAPCRAVRLRSRSRHEPSGRTPEIESGETSEFSVSYWGSPPAPRPAVLLRRRLVGRAWPAVSDRCARSSVG
jgi:hypothetical protein